MTGLTRKIEARTPSPARERRPAPAEPFCELRHVRRWLVLAVAAALALAPLSVGHAQQRGAPARPAAKAEKKEPDPAPQPEPAPPPYDRDLLRLSEIIGALAFLRNLCAAPDAAEWPNRMRAIMETEGVTPNRRDRLAGAYNRGYRGYALTYRACTPSAAEATSRYLAEGERLSQAISGRFGG